MAGESKEPQLRRQARWEQRGIEEGSVSEATRAFTDEVEHYLELNPNADRGEIEKTAFLERMRPVFRNIDLAASRLPTPEQFIALRGALNALFHRESQERFKREAREDKELAEYISTSPTPAPHEIEALHTYYSIEYGELPRDIRISEAAQNLNLLKDLLREWWENVRSSPEPYIARALEALPYSRATLGAAIATQEYLERIQRTFREEARFRELWEEEKARVQEAGEEILVEPAVVFARELPPGRFERFKEYMKSFFKPLEPGPIRRAKSEFLKTKPEITWGWRDALREQWYRSRERESAVRYTLYDAEKQFTDRTRDYRNSVREEERREASEGEAEYTIFSQVLEDVYKEVRLATAIAPESRAFMDFRGALNKLFTPQEQAGFMRDAQEALAREQEEERLHPPPRDSREFEEWDKRRIDPSPGTLEESPAASALRLDAISKHYKERYKEVPQDWVLQDTINDERKLLVLSERVRANLDEALQDGQWTGGDFKEYVKGRPDLRARIGLMILLQEAIRRREWRFANERYYETLKKRAQEQGEEARKRLTSTMITWLQTAVKGLVGGRPKDFFGGLGKIALELFVRYPIGAAMRNIRKYKSLRRRKLSRIEEVK